LLDLNLPRRDGYEVLAEMHADPRLASIPVAIVTASTAEHDAQQARRLGATCYVTKPIDVEQLMCIVRHVEDFWVTFVSLPRAGHRRS
jgi:CheY-like chemotaxis protein